MHVHVHISDGECCRSEYGSNATIACNHLNRPSIVALTKDPVVSDLPHVLYDLHGTSVGNIVDTPHLALALNIPRSKQSTELVYIHHSQDAQCSLNTISKLLQRTSSHPRPMAENTYLAYPNNTCSCLNCLLSGLDNTLVSSTLQGPIPTQYRPLWEYHY